MAADQLCRGPSDRAALAFFRPLSTTFSHLPLPVGRFQLAASDLTLPRVSRLPSELFLCRCSPGVPTWSVLLIPRPCAAPGIPLFCSKPLDGTVPAQNLPRPESHHVCVGLMVMLSLLAAACFGHV